MVKVIRCKGFIGNYKQIKNESYEGLFVNQFKLYFVKKLLEPSLVTNLIFLTLHLYLMSKPISGYSFLSGLGEICSSSLYSMVFLNYLDNWDFKHNQLYIKTSSRLENGFWFNWHSTIIMSWCCMHHYKRIIPSLPILVWNVI